MKLHLRASLDPATFDAGSNTVDVIFSTGADVPRRDVQGPYRERLDMSASAWDLSKLIGGPVLDNHDRSSVRSILGVVEAAKIEAGRGVATVRLSTRPEVAGLAADIGAGIIRAVSIGYTVGEWKESTEGGARVKTAQGIQPAELSFAPIGADPQARTRSEDGEDMELSQRLRAIAEAVRVPETFVTGLLTRSDITEDTGRAAIIAEAARLQPTINHRAPASVSPVTEAETYSRAAADALTLRVNPSHRLENELSRQFVGRRLADVARLLLAHRGLNSLGGDVEIIDRSLSTTSDFPNLLGVFANKVLAASYALAPSGMKLVMRRGPNHNDFRGRNILRRGEMPALEKVNEKGEFKRGSVAEAKDGYSITTYGKVFGISRQALINDDLGAFADIASGYGLAAAETENQLLVDTLTANTGGGPKLGDNTNLFHANHGNLAGAGAVISDVTLSAARLAMRTQKGLNGTAPISATPKYLLVPAALETTAEKYLSALYPAAASNVNPFSGNKLELIVDARLDAKSATRWYIFADPAVLAVIEWAYLAGYEGVQIETRAGFDVDGVEVKARLDFGAGGVDFRGAYMNPGA